jgi:Na+-driven multidrug efflux pump
MKKQIDVLQGNVRDTFISYLIPSVSATIMISFNYFIDTLCIGQKLGEPGLAALNLAWPITTVLYSIGLLFGVGGGTVFSAYIATNKTKQARSVYTGALLCILCFGILLTVLSLIFLDPLVYALGGRGEIRQGVTDYVKWVVIFSLAYMGECFYTSFLRNDNSPKLAMAGTLLACSLNIVLDILFIYVLDGGMVGAALATSLAVTATVILGIGSSFRKRSNLKFYFAAIKFTEIKNTIKVGMSVFLTEIDVGLVTFVYNMVLLRIAAGNSASLIAVYGIVVNVNTIVLAAVNGVANTMQPIVSANRGAIKIARVHQATRLAVKFALVMAVIFVIGIEWQAEAVVKIFLEPGDAFLSRAALAVRIVSLSYILAGVNMILIAYFQAVQAAREAIAFSFIRTLVFPIIYVVLGSVVYGEHGVWGASILIEATTFIILVYAYFKYQKNKVQQWQKDEKSKII